MMAGAAMIQSRPLFSVVKGDGREPRELSAVAGAGGERPMSTSDPSQAAIRPDGGGKAARSDRPFRELDDLVLHLKGLVLVRNLRRQRGAGADELDMYGVEIERARDRLARFAREGALPQLA